MVYDCIIIGRGPAGLSAAIYLARANKKVLVIGKENKIWKKEVKINNYFGTGEITGKALMEKGEAQAKSFGAEIIDSLVTKVSQKDKYFECIADEKEYLSKKILIATGSAVQKKEISNQDDFIGRGVSFCVPCDGFFFKDKKVFVVGSTDYALEEAKELLNYTKDVTIVSNGKKPSFSTDLLEKKSIKYEDFSIDKIIGEKKVAELLTVDGKKISADGIFIVSGDADSNDLARMIGVFTENNKIAVDSMMKTNIEGVFAAGDCTSGFGQVATAVAKGAIAAMVISKEE